MSVSTVPMPMRICLLLIGAVLGALAALTPGRAAVRPVAESRHAVVLAEPGAERLAQEAARVVEEAVPRVEELTGLVSPGRIEVRVYADARSFGRATHTGGFTAVPEAMSSQGIVLLRRDASGLQSDLHGIVAHEVAHAVVWQAAGPASAEVPIWLNEGLAEEAQGHSPAVADRLSAEAKEAGRLPRLGELGFFSFAQTDTVRPFGPRYAYAQSLSAVHFLRTRYGANAIAGLILAMRREGRFGPALKEVAGLSPDELEAAWRDSLPRAPGWADALDVNLLLWAAMVLLLLAAGVRLRLARRRREHEEEPEVEE